MGDAGCVRRVRVRDFCGQIERTVDVQPESCVADLVRTSLEQLNLPRNSPDGALVYRARHRGRLVPPTDRVDDTLETNDEVIELIPEPTAG